MEALTSSYSFNCVGKGGAYNPKIKENINLLLSEWGDENLNWNMEIGDNESNSHF